MKVITRSIPYRADQKIKLIPLSDIHLGNALCAKKHFKNSVNRYADDPNAYFLFVGDLFDGILPQTHDKRFKQSMLDPDYVSDRPINDCVKDAVKILAPIKDRILCMCDGNHELSVMDRCGIDMTGMVLDGLGLSQDVRLGYAGFVILTFPYAAAGSDPGHTKSLTLYVCHGVGGAGKTEGGFMTTIGNNAKCYQADIQIYGHNHRLGGWDNIVISADRRTKKIKSLREIRLNSGTFLRGFADGADTSYSEKAQYRPAELGYMKMYLEFSPRNGMDINYSKKVFL